MSSHGVLRAMMSGMLCADIAARCLDNELSEAEAAARYRTWIQAQFDGDVGALRGLYATHPSARFAEAFC